MASSSLYYPPADRRSAWYGDDFPGGQFSRVDKVLLHTTEGGGWPPYKGGSEAPNLTYWPAKRQWKQHFALNRSARALNDPSNTTVRENRLNVIQVEIVAVCDPSVYERSSRLTPVHQLSPEALGDLGAFLAFMHEYYRVPLVAAPRWLPYPRSAGNSPVRMNGRQFEAFRGICGHQHASGNAHGDPGALNIQAVIRAANRAARPTTPAPQLTVPVQPVQPAVRTVRPRKDDMYRLLRTPDKRYWGAAGLQVTHLENGEILGQYLKMTGLSLDNAVDVTYELLENFQRIT